MEVILINLVLRLFLTEYAVGNLKYGHAGKSHLNQGKSRKRIRNLNAKVKCYHYLTLGLVLLKNSFCFLGYFDRSLGQKDAQTIIKLN